MFTINATKQQLQRTITAHQRQLNVKSRSRERQIRSNIIVDHNTNNKKARNSTEHKAIIHRDLAQIQRDQIQLRKLDYANDMIKSRIQDEQNLLNNTEKFPYGKENVNISEDVLERFKGNYAEQSRIIEKFRKQAEIMKKTSRQKRGINVNLYDSNREHIRQMDRKMREAERRKFEQQQISMRQMENKNMKKIADTLSGLANQLHNNSFTLQKGIRQLQGQLKKQPPPVQSQKPAHSIYRDVENLSSQNRKIPVVVYNNIAHDARIYFSDVYKSVPKLQKKQCNDHKQYKYIMKVLKANNSRLQQLDSLFQYESFR